MSHRTLQPFINAGIISASQAASTDVLLELAQSEKPKAEISDEVVLGLALALRAPSEGSVCVDLNTIANRAVSNLVDESVISQWPTDAKQWAKALSDCTLLVCTPDQVSKTPRRPLVLNGSNLYLARSWDEETKVSQMLRMRAESGRLEILLGGPGTGKTTKAAEKLVAAFEGSTTPPDVAMAAPTGKAAKRAKEALLQKCVENNVSEEVRKRFEDVPSTTLHKLLGYRSSARPGLSRFKYNSSETLPYEYVIIDETSMVSLPMMSRLLQALRQDARLMLVGDPNQLASVEAGTVLADIEASAIAGNVTIAACIQSLTTNFRFADTSGIKKLADAVKFGDPTATLAALSCGTPDLTWVNPTNNNAGIKKIVDEIVRSAETVCTLAANGDSVGALNEITSIRTLCAHNLGPTGVFGLNSRVEQLLGAFTDHQWYLGKPIMVTKNNPTTQLFNGDMGVVVATPQGGRVVAFPTEQNPRLESPARLDSYETVHAMTIHKSQGSEFDRVVVILPTSTSPLLTRELLYTAATRAKTSLVIVATAEAITTAVTNQVSRATGLATRL